MSKKFFEPTPEMNQLLSRAGSLQREESLAATSELAKALELPLRQGVMSGNILGDIFEAINLQPGATAEFPLDFLAPGTEKEFVAFTIPTTVVFQSDTSKAITSWFQRMTLALPSTGCLSMLAMPVGMLLVVLWMCSKVSLSRR